MAGKTRTNCPDCNVAIGQPHHQECDVAQCLRTGLDRYFCPADHDCGADVWTGELPGTQECFEYGFVRTYPDVHRLHSEANWDPEQRRWVKPSVD